MTEHKANKANGVDRPAQSDYEEQDGISVSFLFYVYTSA